MAKTSKHNDPQNEYSTARTVITVSAVLLSACAAIITFWVMTKIEERGVRGDGGGAVVSTNISGDYSSDDYGSDIYRNDDYNTGLSTSSEIPASEVSIEVSLYDDQTNQAYNETNEKSIPASNRKLTPPPSSSIQMPEGPSVPYMVNNASPHLNLFALTFDGGSHANAAADILDTLASRNVNSTMFLTGEFIRKYPHVVSRIAAEGHELGNHTHRHPRLTSYAQDHAQRTLPNVTRELVHSELSGAAQLLADRTGLRFAPLWRAPYGEYNQQICAWALEAGYVHIGWRQGRSWWHNLDTNDWIPDESYSGYRTPQQVYDKITNIASRTGGLNGGIILMHLGTDRKQRDQQVHTILGKLIDDLRAMGYEPVKVSELLYRTGIDVNTLAFGEN